jgi:hypothetical protein
MTMTLRMSDVTVPEHLQPSFTMVRGAYPEGIPEEDYPALVILLAPGMGYRTLAHLMAACTGKEYPLTYHDVLKAQSPFNTDKPSVQRIEEVKRRLQAHGYDEWVAEEP